MRSLEEQADFDLLCGIEERVRARLGQVGYDALSEPERTFLVIWDLEAEVANGGFDQYLFNDAGNHAKDAPEALSRIGARRTAEIVADMLAVFAPVLPSEDRFERQAQLEGLSEDRQATMEKLGDKFHAYPDPLKRLLASYVRSCINEFGEVASPGGPAFPALAVGRGDSFVVLGSMELLSTATVSGLRGFCRDLWLFDSNGMLWPVGALPTKQPGLVDRLFNRMIHLHFAFGEPKAGRQAEVVEWLCELVEGDPDDLYDQFVSHDELKRLFRAAETAKVLIAEAKRLGAQAAASP